MTVVFWFSYVALWVIVALLLILTLALFRQFGLNTMPARQRISMGGLPAGSTIPSVVVDVYKSNGATSESYASVELPALLTSKAGITTVVFGGPECPICKELWPSVSTLPSVRPDSGWVWVDGATRDSTMQDGWTYAISSDLSAHRTVSAPMLPFAYVTDDAGRVLTKGLVNRPQDLVQLLDNAREAGRSNRSSRSGSARTVSDEEVVNP